MYDRIEKIHHSLIHHGHSSHRIYLMHLARKGYPAIIEDLEALAIEQCYTKIVAKVPAWAQEEFTKAGYTIEATVAQLFNGIIDGFFMARYFSDLRATISPVLKHAINQNIRTAREKEPHIPTLPLEYSIRLLALNDATALAALYEKIFPSYPFPITDPAYIKKTMHSHLLYAGIFHGATLVSAASAEMSHKERNVEMTDFATDPNHTGHGFGKIVLQFLEKEMIKRGIYTAFTIARALSPQINSTFAQMGYTFAGTLINNTNISGSIESMNIWYRCILPRQTNI